MVYGQRSMINGINGINHINEVMIIFALFFSAFILDEEFESQMIHRHTCQDFVLKAV